MEMQISILSPDEELAVDHACELQRELEFFVPEANAKQVEKALQPDDAAVGVMDVAVKLLFGTDLLAKVVDVFKSWVEKRGERLQAKSSKIQLDIKDENGKTFSLVIENVKDLQSAIEALKPITTTI